MRYWAGAKRAAGCDDEQLDAPTVAALREVLGERVALAKIAEVASFLVDGQVAGDSALLHDGAVVDVLPPFAGG